MPQANLAGAAARWRAILCILGTVFLAFCIRLIEWPSWQNPEYSYAGQMLLATHDAYHWLAGAVGFGLAKNHPMAELLRGSAWLLNMEPANVAFWYPPVLASLLAGLVAFWAWILGAGASSLAAGLIASIAPGFLARTLLGYYDTDLVTLLFPLLMALGPVLFSLARLHRPVLAAFSGNPPCPGAPDARWAAILAIFGLVAWASQAWHSVFPYLGRFDVAMFAILALFLSCRSCRRENFAFSLCYGFPALAGWWGLAWPAAMLLAGRPSQSPVRRFLLHPAMLAALAGLLAWLFTSGEIARTIIEHAGAYIKRGGDAHGAGNAILIYPSVAQSIIEVQDLSLAALFPYFHPWQEAALAGLVGYCWLLFKKPAVIFLLPLLVLALLSQKLGGRMVMFGAPVIALGIAVPVALAAAHFAKGKKRKLAAPLCCLALTGLMVCPFLDMIPALSQGPSLNRRHAQALARAREITPPDAMLWLWWDFGYAAHYFARRETICDGARHGGPSLYLPAALFATDNPRFGRQLVARAANCGREAGDFFRGLNAEKAQALIASLKSGETPLIETQGRQYIIASFEALRLGFWISNYGSWNFVTRRGGGGALSILPQALSYRLKAGEVRLDGGGNIIFPTSINVFEETGLISKNYVREWFAAHPKAAPREAEAWLATRRNINFLLNRVTDEKIAADQTIYNSLLVQLLICDPRDPAITPYFRLVYDNVFTRIWEVVQTGSR